MRSSSFTPLCFGLLAGLLGGALHPERAAAQTAPSERCKEIEQIPTEECEALFKLYEATNGAEWLNSASWLVSDQPCSWFGVSCALGGQWPLHVSKIELSNNNLDGPLPEELGFLSRLEALVIDVEEHSGIKGKLRGVVPVELAQIATLEVLSLAGNDLKTFTTELVRLSELRVLRLARNQMTGPLPPGLDRLTALEELDVSHNRMDGFLPAALGRMPSLLRLYLGHNAFGGPIPPELGDLLHLSALDLSGNHLTGPVPDALTRLNDLFWLSLTGNRLDGTLSPALARFAAALGTCSLADNPGLCLPAAAPYQTLGTSICGLPLDPACRFCNQVDGLSPSECGALETLYYATGGPDWTRPAGWLVAEAPCDWEGVGCEDGVVRTLRLPQNNLSGTLPPELADLTHLDVLDLSGNRLQGPIPLDVARLGASVADCNLTGNAADLCIAADAPFRALGRDPLCGLPLRTDCSSLSIAALARLEAVPDAEGILISWAAIVNTTGVRFVVEQWVNGRFEPRGTVESDGGTTYVYRIPPLTPGTYTFRLKQIASDGAVGYSDPLDVAYTGAHGVVVDPPFPNPFSETATIRFALSTSQDVTAILYDAVGRRVRRLYRGSPPAHQIVTLRVESDRLAPGLYVVRLTGPTVSAHRALLHLR